MYASGKVRFTFNTYSGVMAKENLTGAEAARKMLDHYGLHSVGINGIGGELTDNYNPRVRLLNLSDSVYGSRSIGAISVACHEADHAVQHEANFLPLKIRNAIVPAVNFASSAVFPMFFVGLLLLRSSAMGATLMNVAIIIFLVVVAFHLITLPVEIDASRRAMKAMKEMGLLASDELVGARKVLTAAAMTYVAALAMSLANLLRLIALRDRNS